MPRKAATAEVIAIGGQAPTDSANDTIAYSEPYRVEVTIEGDADIIFHRWNVEAIDEKAKAAKGSKAKKTDDIESFVYRDEEGHICIPGDYLRGAIVNAAKFKQDPRSPRKSAMDLFKAAVISLTPLASLGAKKWDYEDRRRMVVQRNAINRVRPAIRVGWQATFILQVNLPEYVSQELLREVIGAAGRLVGLADSRPTYGRFSVVKYEVLGD